MPDRTATAFLNLLPQRMLGKRVRFLTGTDEHGEKIALAAAGRGMSPKEHCDSIVDEYKSLWGKVCACEAAFT